MAIHSDMQGPCPDGFHVPLSTEWQAVYDIWTALGGGSSDGTNFGIALKLPKAGFRNYSSVGIFSQGSFGYYWSSSPYPSDTNYAYNLYLGSTTIKPQFWLYRSHGFSVRCFKNSPTVPTSSWTKLYGTSIEAGGIFWSSADGLISLSSDGNTWITIQDKNLGATTVWNNGNTLSETNCGKYYQWGNNYGFPFTGNVTTSSTQVDASNYGPGNYYNSSTYITGSADWSSVQNDNLRGGVTQGIRYDPIKLHGHIGTWHMEWVPGGDDYSAMRGPCDEGYHVPMSSEWQSVYNIWTALGGGSPGTNFGIALKLPFAGGRSFSSAGVSNQGSYGNYWSSSRYNAYSSYYLNFNSPAINPQHYNYRAYGFSVRPFKDIPVEPTSSWTKLYGTSIEAGGIFRNSLLGLISLSSDGTTWITIADKNLGATQVWNSGDTLSEVNCGKYFQWGNNYGFDWTGTLTDTSTTQVDASQYGPGNYYSSSTFIKYNGRWDTTDNANLRGGETGVVVLPGHYQRRTY